MSVDTGQIDAILTDLNGQFGILGCLLVSTAGKVLSSTLPNELDSTALGSLGATLFANNDVSIQRMNRGTLTQMTLLTDQGILHFYQIPGHYLVILTAKGQKVNLPGLINLIEQQSAQLKSIIT